ncbi:MAG: bifunctional metallophosphatase/5'-nucleotidase [Clostridia bacterium]|nr:bifunctional metallophosphatase/5'-nucleotidase [Clostridia bacterium]
MKKLIVIFLIILSLTLTACDTSDIIPPNTDTDSGNDQGDQGATDDGGNGSGDSAVTPDSCKHTDSDSNGKCDGCDKKVNAELDIIAINDLHGKLFDDESHIGADELTTYIKNERAESENFLLLSSGDMWQGTYESNLTKGLMMTDWMNHLGFTSMTLGNHEYDWGDEYIRSNDELAEFPLLAINVYSRETNERMDYCKPSVMVACNGFEIGIIGAIGDCYSSISPDKCKNVYFKVGSELTSLVKAESERLREAGADVIIYSLHDGYGQSQNAVTSVTPSKIGSYYDSSLSDGYVDIVFESHTHQRYILKDTYGVYHLQGGGDNTAISSVKMNYNIVTGECTLAEAETIKTSAYADLPDDPIISELAEKYEETISIGEELIAKIPSKMGSGELRSLIASLYLEAGLEKWGDDYNIFLGGGYLSARAPYDLEAGPVYYKNVYGIFPFDNDLALCSVSGAKLKSQFVNTSNSNYFVGYSEYGAANQGAIDSSATYYIIVDTYSAYYAPNGLTVIDFYTPGVYARDLLADHLGKTYPPPSTEGSDNTDSAPMQSSYYYGITTVKEALDIGENIPVGSESADKHYVIGRIDRIVNTEYGNLYIKGDDGSELYIYGIKDSSGSFYGSFASKPDVGDTVILYAPILNYNGTLELKHAELIYCETEKTVAEALSIGSGLQKNEATVEKYFIRGKVKSISNDFYGNMIIEDESGNTMTVYGSFDKTGAFRFDTFKSDIKVGDTLLFFSDILRYVNDSGTTDKIELKDALIIGKL